jgi:hypothetical protein
MAFKTIARVVVLASSKSGARISTISSCSVATCRESAGQRSDDLNSVLALQSSQFGGSHHGGRRQPPPYEGWRRPRRPASYDWQHWPPSTPKVVRCSRTVWTATTKAGQCCSTRRFVYLARAPKRSGANNRARSTTARSIARRGSEACGRRMVAISATSSSIDA